MCCAESRLLKTELKAQVSSGEWKWAIYILTFTQATVVTLSSLVTLATRNSAVFSPYRPASQPASQRNAMMRYAKLWAVSKYDAMDDANAHGRGTDWDWLAPNALRSSIIVHRSAWTLGLTHFVWWKTLTRSEFSSNAGVRFRSVIVHCVNCLVVVVEGNSRFVSISLSTVGNCFSFSTRFPN